MQEKRISDINYILTGISFLVVGCLFIPSIKKIKNNLSLTEKAKKKATKNIKDFNRLSYSHWYCLYCSLFLLRIVGESRMQ